MTFKISYSNKHYPDSGIQPVGNVPTKLLEKINAWSEEHPPSNEDLSTVAKDVLEVLYYQEFTGSGKHWSYDGCSCAEVASASPDQHVFYCEISHIWDWKDIYAVATGKATISINLKDRTIYVHDFSYYCSG